MGRQGNDPVVIQSSIALLQERFRQLQRVKEMREERQLLKMLTDQPNNNSNNSKVLSLSQYEPLGFFFPPEPTIGNVLVNPPAYSSPSPQLSLSLWPNTRSNYSPHLRCLEPSTQALVANLWPVKTASLLVSATKYKDFDRFDDVDTSLRL